MAQRRNSLQLQKELERLKLLDQLQQLEEEEILKLESETEQEKENETFLAAILNRPEVEETVDRLSNILGFSGNNYFSGEVYISTWKLVLHTTLRPVCTYLKIELNIELGCFVLKLHKFYFKSKQNILVQY